MPKSKTSDIAQNIRNYSIRSGVETFIDKNLLMRLNDFGEYEYADQKTASASPVSATSENVNAMSIKSKNEDEVSKKLFANVKNINHNDAIGYYLDLYAGHVIEGDFRKNGSSGGIATWLLKELLSKKLIDGVIHLQKDHKKNGVLFEYKVSRNIDQVIAGAKTRYYPGELSNVLQEVKEAKGRYAVVGIPSILMEVRLLAIQDPIIAERIAYTIGLICGHQKSAKYAENIAWQCGIKPGDLEDIDFRKKIVGKPASDYATELVGLINGKKQTITRLQTELFGVNWGHGFFKTQFSDYTDDALNETADIALGDAWLEEYVSDSKGNNVVIVRNSEIAEILKDGIESKKLKLDIVDAATIIRSQSGLIHHTRDELPYRLYIKDKKGDWRPKKRVEASSKLPYLRKRVQDLRLRIAQDSHIKYSEAVAKDDWMYFYKKMRKYVFAYSALYYLILLKKNGPIKIVQKITKRVLRTVAKNN